MDHSMYRARPLLLLIVFVKILVSGRFNSAADYSASVATAAEATATQSVAYYQPALIGFRCEGENDQTLDGISIIEANSPVKITLFGEAFTTDTIVAFTTEIVQEDDELDQVTLSSFLNKEPSESQARASSESVSFIAGRLQFPFADEPTATTAISANNSTSTNKTETESAQNSSDSAKTTEKPPLEGRSQARATGAEDSTESVFVNRAQEHYIRAKKFKRRLLGKSHDCTDYDRVISYRLTEDHIITPNVAMLTVRLPELDQSSSGVYYYFCLKQPPIPSRQLPHIKQADYADETRLPAIGAPLNQQSQNLSMAPVSELVWVHQGTEWWLTLKAEPPILSVTNDCLLIILLLFLSAVSSGLNLGLMSLDMNELAVISSCGDQRERSYARTIAPLRKRGNYLLCSLLLGNVMVNSTLTVILEEMTSGVVAVIGSTLAIVILGEIVPQAFCARRGLAIGAKTVYLTYAFMLITFPLSYPISCLLDCVLGEERGNVYDRERLMEFIRITGNHTQLEADEVAIISGALKLKKIRVDQIMTRIEDVFMLPIDCMLNRETIKRIIEKGYSRIPVYDFGDRKQIVALILAKDLALLDPDDQVPLANMLMYCKHPLIFIEDTATLDVALNEFKTGKSHMAIVRQIYDDGEVDKYYEAIGVVTLEDVIEEVLQTEINDETDTLSDNRRKRRRTEAQVAHLVENLAAQQPAALTGPNSTKF